MNIYEQFLEIDKVINEYLEQVTPHVFGTLTAEGHNIYFTFVDLQYGKNKDLIERTAEKFFTSDNLVSRKDVKTDVWYKIGVSACTFNDTAELLYAADDKGFTITDELMKQLDIDGEVILKFLRDNPHMSMRCIDGNYILRTSV